MAGTSDRIIEPNGSVVRDDLTVDQARALHHQLTIAKIPHFWQRYMGAAGWNSVAGYFISVDAHRGLRMAEPEPLPTQGGRC